MFHRPGLIFFWALNGSMELTELQRQLGEFAAAKVSAIVLHPRAGLTLPYGGGDWFDRIEWICDRCEQLDLDVWLYDEDPFPSGAAGGRLVAENPELIGYQIERFVADENLKIGDNFCFPAGKLLWCGWVCDDDASPAVDLTPRVGMVRRRWHVLDPWDSRFYYPEIPRYSCPRAMTVGEEYAVRVNQRMAGMRLMAFVARPALQDATDSTWSALVDWLNPAAAQRFIEMTHERYRARLGDRFGRRVRAIFTDEPKFQSAHPFTPGMIEAFAAEYGYDLRPRLHHLFENPSTPLAATTRLHYRQWCARRFEQAWLEPVARWCAQNQLPLVGHISPEDDPIQQAQMLGNLLPLMRHFEIPGIDLIVPAVGDRQQLLLNVGVIAAASVAQQNERAGVLSESLACSGPGEQTPADQVRKILLWQAIMGVTTPVVHAAFESMEGNRAVEAPPDFGPNGPYWHDMRRIADELRGVQAITAGARQIAPVAILWPIRTFQMLQLDWQHDGSGLRKELNEFVGDCLDRQIGVHFLDESALWDCAIEDGHLRLGLARYSHVLVVSARILHARSIDQLRLFRNAHGTVMLVNHLPQYVQTDAGVTAFSADWASAEPARGVLQRLPRLIVATGETRDLRCTAWETEGHHTALLMNLTDQASNVSINGVLQTIEAAAVIFIVVDRRLGQC